MAKKTLLEIVAKREVNHSCLTKVFYKGLRNRNWVNLQIEERALFRCALWVTKVRGRVSNAKLMVQVLRIAMKLLEGAHSLIVRAGRTRVREILQSSTTPNGIASWAPRIKEWLNDSNYIYYLGMLVVNH